MAWDFKTTKMNRILIILLVSIVIVSCAQKPQYKDEIPKHQTLTISSTFVHEERIINIWTPANYEQSTDSLPVLYMADGGIQEDFPHIAKTLSQLIENNSIPPIILVGIENTERGRDLTGFSETKYDAQYCPLTDGAKDFRAFITEELIPEINSTYRTTHEKGLIGESLSGLFVMETLFLQPTAFDFYIAMDPSLWWNNHYLVRMATEYLDKFPDKEIKLWFAGSGAQDISIHTNSLATILKEYKPKNLQWKYVDEPKEKHYTIFRATKEKALIWILNKSE